MPPTLVKSHKQYWHAYGLLHSITQDCPSYLLNPLHEALFSHSEKANFTSENLAMLSPCLTKNGIVTHSQLLPSKSAMDASKQGVAIYIFCPSPHLMIGVWLGLVASVRLAAYNRRSIFGYSNLDGDGQSHKHWLRTRRPTVATKNRRCMNGRPKKLPDVD